MFRAGFAASAAVALGSVASHPDSLSMGISQLTVGELKHLLSEAEVDFRDCIEKSELAARLRETLPSMPARARDRLDALLSQVGAVSLARGFFVGRLRRGVSELYEGADGGGATPWSCSSVALGPWSTSPPRCRFNPAARMDILDIPPRGDSGFVWDQQGHLVTNFHVIKDAQSAKVTMSDGKTYDAKLVGYEADKDLAVLKLVNGGGTGYIYARLGARRLLAREAFAGPSPWAPPRPPRGPSVFAIGNPFGLDQTLTAGIVSGVGRDIKSITDTPHPRRRAVDAAINPGNSGGPLLDSRGRLIGVNTVIYSPSGASSGVGFAIPSDTVRRVVNQIILRGRVVRAGV